jgi:polyisoprenoid-binding protein YceI
LKCGDFFDAANHSKLTFKASSFTKTGADYEITEDLSMHGVTKFVKFPAEFSGLMTDPWGNTKAGFEHFWKNKPLRLGFKLELGSLTGGVLVSIEVKLDIELQLLKQY